jgi:APA family basic amino acid/polyamine antiporter
VYARAGFGDFAAFLVAWGYWISVLCTNAAIAVTFVSYLAVFFPSLGSSSGYAVSAGLAAVWLLTWVNTRGIKAAGRVQVITTVMKLTPLVGVALIGLFYINPDHFVPFNISGESDFDAVTATATLTLFAFLGMECATIPSANIRSPEKTIPRATMIGTGVTILVYILGSVAVMGILSPTELQHSSAPFADAASLLWGPVAGKWVAVGAIVSTFGALNGWILIQGQIPLAAASDTLFPSVFARLNRKGIPVIGVILSSVLISMFMIMNFSRALNEMFKFMILLGTLTVLVPYLFSAAAHAIILLRQKDWKRKSLGPLIIASVAFSYSIWAVVGSGQESVYWGFVAMMCGIPFYVWMKRARPDQSDER